MGKGVKIVMFLVAAMLFACQQEEDCVGCNINPKIKIEFEATGTRIRMDSLLTAVNKRISLYSDSLGGELSTEVRNQLLDALTSLRNDSSRYDEAITLFRAGKIKVNAINAIGALNLEQFQDSIIRDFAIPVDMQHDTSTFFFTYHDLTDTLQVYYLRDIDQTLDGIRMRLREIGVNPKMSTFDSVKVKCYNRDCSNDLTTIYVYF